MDLLRSTRRWELAAAPPVETAPVVRDDPTLHPSCSLMCACWPQDEPIYKETKGTLAAVLR